MVIQTASPRSLAAMMAVMSLVSVAREEVNLPTIVFSPTRMQPRVSAAMLPLCMRMPVKPGTPTSKRKPATEAGRFRYDHWITALGNGRQPHYLASRKPPNQFRVIR